MIACIWPNEQHGYETLSTLRFASRMKNIENTPVRNNVRNKDLGSRFQQQVEQLKRELIMRDAVCGVEAWLPELNKQQRERTIKCACTIALNNNSTSSSSSSSFFPSSSALGEHSSKPGEYSVSAASLTDTQQDTTLDVLDLHVRSLSHVRLLVGTFRALLWEACGQDEVVVERVCQSVCAKYDVVDNKILGAVIVRSGESEGGVVGVTGVSGASASGSGGYRLMASEVSSVITGSSSVSVENKERERERRIDRGRYRAVSSDESDIRQVRNIYHSNLNNLERTRSVDDEIYDTIGTTAQRKEVVQKASFREDKALVSRTYAEESSGCSPQQNDLPSEKNVNYSTNYDTNSDKNYDVNVNNVKYNSSSRSSSGSRRVEGESENSRESRGENREERRGEDREREGKMREEEKKRK